MDVDIKWIEYDKQFYIPKIEKEIRYHFLVIRQISRRERERERLHKKAYSLYGISYYVTNLWTHFNLKPLSIYFIYFHYSWQNNKAKNKKQETIDEILYLIWNLIIHKSSWQLLNKDGKERGSFA